jgi:DNA-binding CsgD family transcriptional regulator
VDEVQHARIAHLRARIAFARGRGREAPVLLLRAARRLGPLDVAEARETYLEALDAVVYAGRFADRDQLAAALAGAPATPRHERLAADLLLDGHTVLFTAGLGPAVPELRRALRALGRARDIRWLGLACRAAAELWDDETWHELARRQHRIAVETGALAQLPAALNHLAVAQCWHAGDLAAATALIEDVESPAASTGSPVLAYGAISVAAWRGGAEKTEALIEAFTGDATARGEGRLLTFTDYATAVLRNGLGDHAAALEAARRACEADELMVTAHALPELIEAAVRTGDAALAAAAVAEMSGRAALSGTQWARGIDARCRALAAPNEQAEPLYREALDRLGRCGAALHLGRAHLLYGEWLRAQGRRSDARAQLRQARNLCARKGAAAFAARAARQLDSTGRARHSAEPAVRATADLTAQEALIARLAGEGCSNADIGARVFISPRTVEYHLRKVFLKLGIESRRQLRYALADGQPLDVEGAPAEPVL